MGGACHTTQSKIEASKEHRPLTIVAYGFLDHYGKEGITVILDLWLTGKFGSPKSRDQMRLLFQLAHRFMGDEKDDWKSGMRKKYPSLQVSDSEVMVRGRQVTGMKNSPKPSCGVVQGSVA